MRKIFLHFGKTGVTLAPLPFLLKMIPVFGLIRVVFPQAAVFTRRNALGSVRDEDQLRFFDPVALEPVSRRDLFGRNAKFFRDLPKTVALFGAIGDQFASTFFLARAERDVRHGALRRNDHECTDMQSGYPEFQPRRARRF